MPTRLARPGGRRLPRSRRPTTVGIRVVADDEEPIRRRAQRGRDAIDDSLPADDLQTLRAAVEAGGQSAGENDAGEMLWSA